ncbi:MAG: hypothetical protein R3B09_09565 [Nannocystaceae bacterium]
MPWLILLRDSSAYPVLRSAVAALAGVAAAGWIAERLAGLEPTLPTRIAEAVAAQAPWCVVGLAAAATLHVALDRRPRAAARGPVDPWTRGPVDPWTR